MATSRALFVCLLFAAPALAANRIELDPALAAVPAGERAALVDEARACLDRAQQLLARPAARAHFQQVYGLNPGRLMTGEDRAIVVCSFPVRGAGAGVQVGGYVFGDPTVSLNVDVLRAARRARNPDTWRAYIAGVLVHEMAHLADWLDDGQNNDGGLDGEEGEEAQKIAGCALAPPAPLLTGEHLSLRDEIWSWRAPEPR